MTRIIQVGKKLKMPKPTPIEDGDAIIPGMWVAHKKELGAPFRVVFAESFRDAVVVCLDDCGHTVLVPVWDGDYVIIPNGSPKVRIVYGKTIDGELSVSKGYYYNEQDFKDKRPQYHFWYVEALKGTEKFVSEEKIDPNNI